MAACEGRTTLPTGPSVTAIYEDIGSPGYISQTVQFAYAGFGLIVFTAEYLPLDSAGDPIEGITVTTAFGSDKGTVAISSPGDSMSSCSTAIEPGT